MTPNAEKLAALYDFRNVLETALQAVFTANQVTAFTTQDFGKTKDDGKGNQVPVIDFQRARPRSEITFTEGPGRGQFRPLIVEGQETAVETSFSGTFTIHCITEAKIQIHAAYVVMVRYLMHTMVPRINGVDPMVYHRVHSFVKDASTSPTFEPENGVFQTQLRFEVDFSIQDDAWETIATPDVEPVPPPSTTTTIDDTDGNPLVDTDGNELVGIRS